MIDATAEWAPALGRLASGIFIVTVRNGAAKTGMLASWVQQCSFDPPQISMAIQKSRPVYEWLTEETPFVVNIVGEGQSQFLRHFGKGFDLNEDAFQGIAIDDQASGPILLDALAYLECRVLQRIAAGDHDLVIARVVAGKVQQEGKPFIHVRKNGLNY